MTTPRTLPSRPSLESIRKQAKKLVRDVTAADAEALARVRAHLPDQQGPLSQRNAQMVIAREYGFAGWQDLRAEVLHRMGEGLEWASTQARQAIHDNDVAGLKQLLEEYPALLSWRDGLGETLVGATTSFANDATDPERERTYNRPECAEVLIDAGADIDPSVWERVVSTRSVGMLELLWNKGVLPRTLPILAARGDLDDVRAYLHDAGGPDDTAAVNEAFLRACRFDHKAVAAVLLDQCVTLDDDLGRRIDSWQGRSAFVDYLCEHSSSQGDLGAGTVHGTLWRAFVVLQLIRALDEDDLSASARWWRSEADLLGEQGVDIQVQLLERAAWTGRGPFIGQLLDLDPAVLRRRPPPRSSALAFALEYGNADLVPLLTRIWPLPDDLPHAAGVGDLARVRRWFDDVGRPTLGNPHDHHPANSARVRANLGWGTGNVQQILDVALAWACMNRAFEIASFLLERGADIDTRWATHEPASILHECALSGNYEAARFLIDHGIDMTIRDHRYNATAEGWARYAAKNDEMAELLAAAERERAQRRR